MVTLLCFQAIPIAGGDVNPNVIQQLIKDRMLNPDGGSPALRINVWLRRGLAAAWSQLLAIRLLMVPIGVVVGIGIGIVPTVNCG
jgi:hypothetical protein